ncbi:uncharacterized protein LOC124156565 [Ischnura elegans]|uniref:uncharacterized protein LOC124156565 n=1 Tax=Ischnura elegans TaxID=197161 RepID=UPI001ED88FA8|nr:uncharacterized protein LOC124156565 [Ischnura elegans]
MIALAGKKAPPGDRGQLSPEDIRALRFQEKSHRSPEICREDSTNRSTKTMNGMKGVVILMLGVLALSAAIPLERLIPHRNGDALVAASGYRPSADLQASASGHEHHGRVQIKVYRGPGDHHAPYGYWVKQPADDYHH